MKNLLPLLLIISCWFQLHGMHLGDARVPSLSSLCLKAVAEKTIQQGFDQKLKESGYDFDASKEWIETIISRVSNVVNDDVQRFIKKLYCKKDCSCVFFCKKLLVDSRRDRLVCSVAISPGGKMVAVGFSDGVIRLLNVETGICIQELIDHGDEVSSVVFSSDGETIASGSADKTVRLWNAKTRGCLLELTGHTDWVRSAAISPDGQTVASGSDDGTVRLWDAKTGECLHVLTGHTNWVKSVVFSPDGQTVASGSDDRTARLWDVAGGECKKMLKGFINKDFLVVFSPDGEKVACKPIDKSNLVAYSLDGETAVSGFQHGTGRLWTKGSFDKILFKNALLKAAEERNFEALKWLFSDAESWFTKKLFEREELEVLKEYIIRCYSIQQDDLVVPWYSRMMRRCKGIFSKVL